MGVGGGDNGKIHEVAAGRTTRYVKPRNSGCGNGQYQAVAPRWKMTRYHEMATRKESQAIWRPAVPSWEKEFCLKAIGLFPTWDKFVEAKKCIHLYDNIMQWDDKEAEESFNHSKIMFYAKKFNIISLLKILTPPHSDLYIDKIDWNDSKINDCKLLKRLGLASDKDDEEEEEEEMEGSYATTRPRERWHIAVEDIKPTGWDVEPEEFEDPNNLTGLIVGGHSQYWY